MELKIVSYFEHEIFNFQKRKNWRETICEIIRKTNKICKNHVFEKSARRRIGKRFPNIVVR